MLDKLWAPGLTDQLVPTFGVAVLVLTATTWVVRHDRRLTSYELFLGAKGAMPVLIVFVVVFAVACLLWRVHQSRAAVCILGVLAMLSPLAVLMSGGMNPLAGPWLTLVLCLFTIVCCLVDAELRRRATDGA